MATNAATSGAIQIIGGDTDNLRFGGVTNDANGASLTRGIDLTGATNAVLTYSANPDNLDAGENRHGLVRGKRRDLRPDRHHHRDMTAVNRSIPLTGTVGANSAIRFTVTGDQQHRRNHLGGQRRGHVHGCHQQWRIDSSTAVPVTTRSSGTPIRPALTDGRDVVDGGTEGGCLAIPSSSTAGRGAETYNIYTRAAWQALRQLARRLQ